MTTTAKASAADTILAIDLGKYKSVACVYRSAEDQRFQVFTTSRDELTRLPSEGEFGRKNVRKTGALTGQPHGFKVDQAQQRQDTGELEVPETIMPADC